MKEDLKRELEDLKEPSPERTEELLKDLGKETQEDKDQIKGKKRDLRSYLIFFGIIMSLFGLAFGGFFLWKLFDSEKKGPSSEEMDSKQLAKVREEQKGDEQGVKETAKAESEKIELKRPQQEAEPAFKLKLTNFLFSLDERSFLKVDVHLFFSDKERYLEAQRRELELRAFFYGELKKVRPETLRSEAKMRELEESLGKLLRQRHPQYSPDKIELEGLILKT